MNKVIMMGRLTRDPEIRYGQGANGTVVGAFSIAVDRRFKREGEPDADFFDCTTFGKQAEFVEKYLRKGTKVLVEGEIQNDNYTNKDGNMVYSVRVIANNIEFAESKNASGGGGGFTPAEPGSAPMPSADIGDGFMDIGDGVDDEDIPFA